MHKFLTGARLSNSDDGRGVVVAGIQQGSPAAQSGLRPGDIIVSVNRVPVKTVQDLSKVLKQGGDRLLLRLIRGNAALYLVLQ